MNNSSRILGTVVFMVVAIIFFAIITVITDNIYRQYQSGSFPSTTGKVNVSGVTVSHGSRGRTYYHVHIIYDYAVGGRTYENATFRYGPASTSQSQAEAEVEAHPEGSEIAVYYRADDPQDSLISPGVVGSDFEMLFLVVPATVFILYQLGNTLDYDLFRRGLPAGGVTIISQGSRVIARLPPYTPFYWSVMTFCGAGFAAALILPGTTRGDASTQPELFAVVVIFAVAAGVYASRQARLRSGADDLVIDGDAKTLVLPQTFGRNSRVNLDFSVIGSVRVAPIKHRRRRGYSYSWAVFLVKRIASGSPEKLADWSPKEKSMAFAAWLREHLKLSPEADRPADDNPALLPSSDIG